MSLPELPTTSITTAGDLRVIHGRTVVVLDYTAPRGPHRGRRFRIDPVEEEPGTTGCTRVIFHLEGHAALHPPPWAQHRRHGQVQLRLRALPDRRPHRIPDDLRAALESAGVGSEHLTAPELEQMVEMIVEAHDPSVRAARVASVVITIAAAREQPVVRP